MSALALPPGLILAGGRSSRMGTEKALLDLGDQPLLAHVARRLAPQVSVVKLNAPPGFPAPLALPLLPDTLAGQLGPLAGVLAGLGHLQPGETHLLTVPCDSPFFPLDLAARLRAQADDENSIVVAASDGRLHPVFCLWPRAIAEDLQDWLADPDNRRIQAFLRRHRMVTVDFSLIDTPEGTIDPFLNINTPEDLETARRFAGLLA
ncbi:molybdenum cofactor guanylyltransferase MobA [Rhizobium deserti]|uniref:Molybdenum cofactor guanylyltransferase n=1 Tax=Rhizobium deserti TaxID=2547961 RepID=A0A4V3APM9_9HYPH|nr:molybdenum cofactor guanylyltransferase MobA [Rhizobium deserti]TDK37595.1 molybdenum cofactor guanylyltransferase MobA [Rhizobium deserti]